MKMLRLNLISFILILIVSTITISCESVVFIEPSPETLPGPVEKIQLETIDFSSIPELEKKKIIINTYAVFIHDILWRINHSTALLINGNISPSEHDEAVRSLYEDLAAFKEKFDEYKESLEDT